MNTRDALRRALPFVMPLLLLACAPPAAPVFDAKAESAKLLARDAEWSKLAADSKNAEQVASYFAEDAVFIQPAQAPIEGRAAIRKFIDASYATPGFKISWVSQDPKFSPDGKLAYMRGLDEMTVPGPKGAPMVIHQQGLTVWRVDPDGQWRVVIDIGNEVAPPAAPAKK